MTNQIIFYFPDHRYDPIPEDIRDYAAWQMQIGRTGGLIGPACWTVQTYLRLREYGFACRMSQELPDEGVVIAHYDDVPRNFKTLGRAYWVCVLADRHSIHPFAHFHITQDPNQILRSFQPFAYVPLWPQAGLVARDASRGNRFERICYFGERENLAAELSSSAFEDWCSRSGLSFVIIPRERWYDYSQCDVMIAARSLDGRWIHGKPASKLINAWSAGVPAVMGRESSYRAVGVPGKNYIEVACAEEVVDALQRLKHNLILRRSLVEEGRLAGIAFSSERICARWLEILARAVVPRAEQWRSSFLRRFGHRSATRFREGLAWRFGLLGTMFTEGR